MFDKKTKSQYEVLVDDNYHHANESDRYTAGSYVSLDEAIDKCREITIKSLEHFYEEGITPEALSAQWAMFGEDPYVFGGRGAVPFSARKFVSTELCKEIIDAMRRKRGRTD